MTARRSLILRPATDVRPESPRWAWASRIPLGAVTLLAGREGLGKSTVAIELGAQLTRGALPGDLQNESVGVIYASAEDSPESTIVPRLLAAGADLGRVSLLEVVTHENAEQLPDALTLPDDTVNLGEVAESAGARLVVLDPLVSYLPAKVNGHRDQHVRRVLAPLARLATDIGVAIIAVIHLNKRETVDVLARVSGSVGFTAAARSVLIVGRDPDDPDGESGGCRILAHPKCNVGPLAPSLLARVEPRWIESDAGETIATSGIVLLGESEHNARDLLAQPATDEERSARDEAADFLRAALAEGPVPAGTVRAEAHEAGIANRTLDRAKKVVGVRARKLREGWVWELKDADASTGALGALGALSTKDTKEANNTKDARGDDSEDAAALAEAELDRVRRKFPSLERAATTSLRSVKELSLAETGEAER